MSSKREYGDEMVARCVDDLRALGVPIYETKSSGSVHGDGDAKMSRSGLMLDGKASAVRVTCRPSKKDWEKLKQQAKYHGLIPILVVENKHRERVAFTTPHYAQRAGIPKTTVVENGLLAYDWEEFCDYVSEAWSNDDSEEEEIKEGGYKRRGNKGFRDQGRRVARDKRKMSTKSNSFRPQSFRKRD